MDTFVKALILQNRAQSLLCPLLEDLSWGDGPAVGVVSWEQEWHFVRGRDRELEIKLLGERQTVLVHFLLL
jgi:hypothetical protein